MGYWGPFEGRVSTLWDVAKSLEGVSALRDIGDNSGDLSPLELNGGFWSDAEDSAFWVAGYDLGMLSLMEWWGHFVGSSGLWDIGATLGESQPLGLPGRALRISWDPSVELSSMLCPHGDLWGLQMGMRLPALPSPLCPPNAGAFMVHVANSCPLAANGSLRGFDLTVAFNKNPLVCYDPDGHLFNACDWGLLHGVAGQIAIALNNDSTWVQRAEARRRACSKLAAQFWAQTALRRSEHCKWGCCTGRCVGMMLHGALHGDDVAWGVAWGHCMGHCMKMVLHRASHGDVA